MPAQRTAPGAFSGTGLGCGAVAARTSASALFPAEKQLVACRCVLRASRPRRRQSQHSAPPRAPLRAVRARAPAWQAASGPGCALAKPGGGRAKHTQVGAPQHAGRARAAPNSAARRVMPFCCQNGTARTAPPPSPCPSPQVPSTRVYSYILQMSIPEGGGRTAYFAAFRVRYVCSGHIQKETQKVAKNQSNCRTGSNRCEIFCHLPLRKTEQVECIQVQMHTPCLRLS